jgi:hypothetical protein
MAVPADSAALDPDSTPPLWLLDFDGKTSSDVLWEPRFISLLKRALPEVTPPFCGQSTLPATVAEFLSGNPANVLVTENQYLVVSGCKRHFGKSKGLLWINCRSAGPTIGFVARSYHQPGEEKVAICVNTAEQIPPQFLASAVRWLSTDRNQIIVEIAIFDALGGKRNLDPQLIGIPARRLPLRRKAKRKRAKKVTI